MVDAIMFLQADKSLQLAYEVAAVMFKKPIVTEENMNDIASIDAVRNALLME